MGRHIYIHNPFCIRKCPYCDFFSVTDTSCVEKYYEAAVREARFWAEFDRGYSFSGGNGPDTVYFGGGTPSCVPEGLICGLLETIAAEFGIGPDAEVTIEVNPASFSAEKGKAYLQSGFNRLSMGIQSLDDGVLRTLGRLHDSKGALKALDSAFEAGFENVSADLITGVPGQTAGGILEDLRSFIDKGVRHISTYSLMIEDGTAFFERFGDCIEELMPPHIEREMYHGVREFLKDNGYLPYEISNSAVPGYESCHNEAYWDGADYYAIGAGAHGFLNSVRFGHRDSIGAYIDGAGSFRQEDVLSFLGNPESPSDQINGVLYCEERLTADDRMREYPFLKLRTSKGMDKAEFSKRFGKDFEDVYGDELRSNIEKGLLKTDGQHISLTERGLDYADTVIRDFL